MELLQYFLKAVKACRLCHILSNEKPKAETKWIYVFTNKVLQSGQHKRAAKFISQIHCEV